MLLLIFCISSYGQEKYEKQNIVITEAKLKNTKIQNLWVDLNSVPREWVKIERDENGYLIYDPCDGSTPSIKVHNEYLTVSYGLKTETFRYGKFKTIVENKSFRIEAYDTRYNIWFIIKAKIIDDEKGIVLCTFDGMKWLIIPVENIDGFRKIKNDCLTEKKPELTFLPVNERMD